MKDIEDRTAIMTPLAFYQRVHGNSEARRNVPPWWRKWWWTVGGRAYFCYDGACESKGLGILEEGLIFGVGGGRMGVYAPVIQLLNPIFGGKDRDLLIAICNQQLCRITPFIGYFMLVQY